MIEECETEISSLQVCVAGGIGGSLADFMMHRLVKGSVQQQHTWPAKLILFT